jgi:hypothetical protein
VRENTKQGHLVLFSRFHTEFDSATSWQKRNFKSANDGWEEWDYSQGRRGCKKSLWTWKVTLSTSGGATLGSRPSSRQRKERNADLETDSTGSGRSIWSLFPLVAYANKYLVMRMHV